MFETASFHIVKPCNMKCKFCYATFQDMEVKQIPFADVRMILAKLKDSGLEKITFAGGEPMLYKHIFDSIEYAKRLGLTTSIITNGSTLDAPTLSRLHGMLDWIGISIDSLNGHTNQFIGRTSPHVLNYSNLIGRVKQHGFKLKINTVVNRYNFMEDMNQFIAWANPARWKVFQALRVEGQNDQQFDEVRVLDQEFRSFIARHAHQKAMVAEDNQAMTGSYLLIDPQGRLFENSSGKHTYSQPLQNSDVQTCLSEINLDREMFIQRGGIYNW